MRTVSDKSCRKSQNTHFMFNNFFSPPENPAVCEIKCKNIVERGKPQMKTWRMRIAWWIHKATHTHSEYVILIAFPLQQWLHERAAMLRYKYIACIVVGNSITVSGQVGFDTKPPETSNGLVSPNVHVFMSDISFTLFPIQCTLIIEPLDGT
jgi:hypothetical protein